MANSGDSPWRLRGTSRQVAAVVAAFLVSATVLVALVDRAAHIGWDSPLLQAWTLVPQTFSAVGLIYLGYRRSSKAFWILGGLILLIVIEEAFHVLNPVVAQFEPLVRWANEWTDIRRSVVASVVIYGFVAVVGLSLLAFSHWHGTKAERPVVRNVAVFLLVAGFFGGPISTVSTIRDPRRWIFIEEVGESIVFALLAAYVLGLVLSVWVRPLRSQPAPREHP